jgi:SAM-dependent methyltransferase
MTLLGLFLAGGPALLPTVAGGPLTADRRALVLPLVAGIGILLFTSALHLLRGRIQLAGDRRTGGRVTRWPYTTLFLASFVVLFIEILLIRYCGSQIRIFAFFRNIPLIASFLGLGLGLCLGDGGPRSVLRFLLWLLPVSVFLSLGAIIVDGYLGLFASAASTEHILGDLAIQEPPLLGRLLSQALVAGFCAGVLVAIMSLFAHLGRLLAAAFEPVPRLAGYTVNILGSLAGILAFFALSYLETPPWIWLTVGLIPLLWWIESPRQRLVASALALATIVSVVPQQGETVWSRYQKLVGRPVELPLLDGGTADAYWVEISDAFYQVALDLSPEIVERYARHPAPLYDAAFDSLATDAVVLVVGSGTGNDVAAALRAGAARVDAVDIDPAILRLGLAHHPERPYEDARVNLIVADARQVFRDLEPGSYDAVAFGLLDSHTQLGMSSLRLDNYVFTVESFESAAQLLKPGGQFIVTAAIFREWFEQRIEGLLDATCGGPVSVRSFDSSASYRCVVAEGGSESAGVASLPTDDWPFLYLPKRSVPGAYLLVVGILTFVSVLFLKRQGLRLGGFSAFHGHLFLLGAAFLLMEVYAINRLALLFGTTWLVSAITIGLVLTLIVFANLTVAIVPRIPYVVSYLALGASLVASFSLNPDLVLGRPVTAQYLYGLAVLSPVYFAGIIFARSFRLSTVAGTALGANILGSALGGWLEYSTMALGIRSMLLVAAALYLGSAVSLWLDRRKVPDSAAVVPTAD